jgi:hypothetical protein
VRESISTHLEDEGWVSKAGNGRHDSGKKEERKTKTHQLLALSRAEKDMILHSTTRPTCVGCRSAADPTRLDDVHDEFCAEGEEDRREGEGQR